MASYLDNIISKGLKTTTQDMFENGVKNALQNAQQKLSKGASGFGDISNSSAFTKNAKEINNLNKEAAERAAKQAQQDAINNATNSTYKSASSSSTQVPSTKVQEPDMNNLTKQVEEKLTKGLADGTIQIPPTTLQKVRSALSKGSEATKNWIKENPKTAALLGLGAGGLLGGIYLYNRNTGSEDDKTTDPTGGTDDNKGGGGNNNQGGGGNNKGGGGNNNQGGGGNNKGGGGNNINRDLYDPIVRRVIRGEFGNGAQRQRALTQMGYDWNDIQGQVNHALGFNGHVRDYLGGGTSSGNGGYSNAGYSNGGYNYTPTNTYKNPNAGKSGYYDFMGQFHETGDMDQNAYNQSQLTSMQQNQKWYESQRNEIVPGTNMTKDELFRQAYEKAKDSNDPSVQQALAQVADELGYNYQYGNTSGLNRGDFIENAGINRNAYAQSQGYKDWADYVDWYENRSNAWNSVYGSPVQRPSAEEYNKIWYTAATYNPNTVQQQQQQGIIPQYSMPVYNGPTYSNNPYQYNNVHGQESEYITLDRNNWLYAGMPQYLKDTQGGNQNLGGNKYYYSL